MAKKPESKKKPFPLWVVCAGVVLATVLARILCHAAGVTLSDTLTRVLGGVQLAAAFVAVFTYVRWRMTNTK